MAYSLGLGLTNDCNLRCPHCYRPTDRIHRLSRADVAAICDSLEVGSANLGTGENGLHPEFIPIVEDLLARGIKVGLTSNGLSVARLPDPIVAALREVEFSFDFPTREGQDRFRGAGAWDMAMVSLARTQRLGVPVTVTAVMMSINYKRMGEIAELAASVGASCRANVYQPVKNNRFSLSYEQFWDGFRSLLGAAALVTTTEPLVNAILGLHTTKGCGCGLRTVRVTPQGRVIPCVYWPEEGQPLEVLGAVGSDIFQTPDFRATRLVPEACKPCPLVETCGGGCIGRRALVGRIDGPDPYCPIIRGDTIRIEATRAAAREYLKAGSACTTIVSAA